MTFLTSLTSLSSRSLDQAFETPRDKFDDLMTLIAPNHFLNAGLILQGLDSYSDNDLMLIYEDLVTMRDQIFEQASRAPTYLATAGAPGCGKTTLLERLIGDSKKLRFAYIDPDAFLNQMERTYRADIAKNRRTPAQAYTHWRDASNFMANFLLALALKEGFAIAHGTTMTSPHIKKMLQSIQSTYDYQIELLHLTVEEPIRVASKLKRESSGDFRCTQVDFENKLAMFHHRLPDYLLTAQKIDFYFRSEMDKNRLVATFRDGELSVFRMSIWNRMEKMHNEATQSRQWQTLFYNAS